HTVSYTAAIALFGGLAAAVGEGDMIRAVSEGLAILPELLRETLDLEDIVRGYVGEVGGARTVWFVGAGANQYTATEAALKMIETNYSTAIVLELEQILHGYFPAIGGADVLWLIAPGPALRARSSNVLTAAEIVG